MKCSHFSHQYTKVATERQTTTGSIWAGKRRDKGAGSRAADAGLFEMRFRLGAWQQFIRNARTFLEMGQDGNNCIYQKSF